MEGCWSICLLPGQGPRFLTRVEEQGFQDMEQQRAHQGYGAQALPPRTSGAEDRPRSTVVTKRDRCNRPGEGLDRGQ